MQTHRHYTLPETVAWSRQYVVWPFLYATAVTGVYLATGWEVLRVPWTPVSLVGVAVAFFVGFKNNSSYGRLWEARQIWGAIVNTSRAWAIGVRAFVAEGAPEGVHRELLYRHIAWLTALRHQLRADRSWEHAGPSDRALRARQRERQVPLVDELRGLIADDELARVTRKANVATQLLAVQSVRLRELQATARIGEFPHVHLQELLVGLFAEQGKCERIKNFPFPRQYASFTLYTVWLLAALLPLALLDVFSGGDPLRVLLAVPASTLITWLFFTAELIGDYSENPFEGLWNDVPITALCRTIEIDLREMMGETDVPPPLQPEAFGLLM